MNSDTVLAKNEVYSAMEQDRPFACYIKTILGKVAVTVWDNILEKPVEVILVGNPRNKDEGCIVKVWNNKEDSFFKRMNVNHFKKGFIIPYAMPEVTEVQTTIEQATDEELAKIINSKYLALVNKLNTIESVAVLFRMKNLAEEMEKSEKITKAIQARISDVQAKEYEVKSQVAEEEE